VRLMAAAMRATIILHVRNVPVGVWRAKTHPAKPLHHPLTQSVSLESDPFTDLIIAFPDTLL